MWQPDSFSKPRRVRQVWKATAYKLVGDMGTYSWWGYVNEANGGSASWTIFIPQSSVVGIASLSEVELGPDYTYLDQGFTAWIAAGPGGSGGPVLAAADVTMVTGYLSVFSGLGAAGFLLVTS
jgi:hypothetical protein